MDALARLQQWFVSWCDGDWEHNTGFQIGTIDNPGWMVEIKLDELGFRSEDYHRLEENSDKDWIAVSVVNNVLGGYGGSMNLDQIINRFIDILEEIQKNTD